MSLVKGPAGPSHFKHLLAILVVLVTVDGIITQFLIRNRLSWELNPILSPLVGQGFFIPLKMFGGLLSAWLLWDVRKRWPKVALVGASSFASIYAGIVLWNLASFLIARG